MTTDQIREELEKLRALSEMYMKIQESSQGKSQREIENIKFKMQVIREDMLKKTYNVGKLLKAIEEKV